MIVSAPISFLHEKTIVTSDAFETIHPDEKLKVGSKVGIDLYSHLNLFVLSDIYLNCIQSNAIQKKKKGKDDANK